MPDTPVLQTQVHVYYGTTDISKDVYEDLLSISYTDKIEDEADELTVTLKDEKGKWAGAWSPERGAKVKAVFNTEGRGSVKTDTMVIDNLKTSGSPRVFEFQAVSIPLDNTFRRTAKTRNFEKLSLKDISKQLAEESNLAFMWDCADDNNPEYDRVDQKQESDLAFLKRLCNDAGLSIKVGAETCIIFDQLSYEKKPSVKTLSLGTSHILSWSFQSQQSQRYKSCTVKWRNVKAKTKSAGGPAPAATAETSTAGGADIYGNNDTDKKDKSKKGQQTLKTEYIDYTYTDESVEESGQEYVLKKRCSNQAEAERVAKATLRKLNLRQTSGSLSLVGDPLMIAGNVIELKGFGSFDGRFIIESANHSMTSGGYTTSIDVRRVNEVY